MRGSCGFVSDKFKFKSKKEKEKWRLFNCAEEYFNTDSFKLPSIYMKGNKEISIEGCKGVFEYKETYIKINLGKGSFIISGCDLEICTFGEDVLNIKGKINSVEFCV